MAIVTDQANSEIRTPVVTPGESTMPGWFASAALSAGRLLIGPALTRSIREMERAQWLSREELSARSQSRLTNLLTHAAANVPFYSEACRRLGIAPDELRGMDALRLFPVLGKSEYRERPERLFEAVNVPSFRRIERSTSGSTGEPFRFAIDRHALPVIYASHFFYDSWFGFKPFDRYVRIMSPPAAVPRLTNAPAWFRISQEVTRRLHGIYESLTQEKISVWEVDRDKAEHIYRRIEAFRPKFIMGYTSTLATIADELLHRGLRLSRQLQGVVTVAETVTPQRRKLIQDYFNAPIVNRYGLREFGSWSAQSCPESPDSFHVNTELVVCEILRDDGTPASPGETGHVVLTDLFNYVRPFIRYDTGDLAVAGSEACACGRGFPLMGGIEGRSQECLRMPSGKVIGPTVLGHFLFVYNNHLEWVRQYQLVQEGPDRASLFVVPASSWSEDVRLRLQRDLRNLLGAEMHVEVKTVKEIPREKSGKRPIIKSSCNQRKTEAEQKYQSQ